MMKKLLVLMLVLGLATAANAAISLSVNGEPAPDLINIVPCTYIVIDITSSNVDPYGAYIGFDDALAQGEWKNSGGGTPWRIMTAAGADASVLVDPWSANWWDVEAKTFNPDKPITAGTHFEFDYHCLGLSPPDVVIQLLNYDLSVADTLTIHQIPEPVSMVLLGLGGLLLRRRK